MLILYVGKRNTIVYIYRITYIIVKDVLSTSLIVDVEYDLNTVAGHIERPRAGLSVTFHFTYKTDDQKGCVGWHRALHKNRVFYGLKSFVWTLEYHRCIITAFGGRLG